MLKSILFCIAVGLAVEQAWANTDCDGHDIGRVIATCGVPYGQVTANQFSNIYAPDPQAFPKATHPVAILVHGSNGYSGGDLHAYTLANDGFLVFQAEYDVVNAGPGNLDLFQSFHEMQLLIRWIRKFASLYDADTGHIGLLGGSAGGGVVTHVANYTQTVTNPADPLFVPTGRTATMSQCVKQRTRSIRT